MPPTVTTYYICTPVLEGYSTVTTKLQRAQGYQPFAVRALEEFQCICDPHAL